MSEYRTIRQTASLGILSEHRLRLMQKQSKLPGIFAGNRFLVNVDLLIRQLEQESLATMRRGDDENDA